MAWHGVAWRGRVQVKQIECCVYRVQKTVHNQSTWHRAAQSLLGFVFHTYVHKLNFQTFPFVLHYLNIYGGEQGRFPSIDKRVHVCVYCANSYFGAWNQVFVFTNWWTCSTVILAVSWETKFSLSLFHAHMVSWLYGILKRYVTFNWPWSSCIKKVLKNHFSMTQNTSTLFSL